MNPVAYTIETTRHLLTDEGFKGRHRVSDRAFTRVRCLPFAVVLVLILRKSVKSLQNVVNEAMAWLTADPVTASAFSQARYRLQHTAFIELNQKAVVESRYRDGNFRTFWGFRILAVDGSKWLLPETDDVVPVEWSEEVCDVLAGLSAAGEIPFAPECYFYDLQPHTFRGDGDGLLMRRVAEFFGRH